MQIFEWEKLWHSLEFVCVSFGVTIITEWKNTFVGVYFMSQEPGDSLWLYIIVSETRPMMISIIGEYNRSLWLINPFKWYFFTFWIWICFRFRINYDAMFVSFTWSVDHPLLPRLVFNVIRPIKMFFTRDSNVCNSHTDVFDNQCEHFIKSSALWTHIWSEKTTRPNTMGHFQMLYVVQDHIVSISNV